RRSCSARADAPAGRFIPTPASPTDRVAALEPRAGEELETGWNESDTPAAPLAWGTEGGPCHPPRRRRTGRSSRVVGVHLWGEWLLSHRWSSRSGLHSTTSQ